SPFILNSNKVKAPIPNIKPGIVLLLFTLLNRPPNNIQLYDLCRTTDNDVRRFTIFYNIHSPSSLTIYLTMRQISSAFAV
ncbi:hypothetical protein NSB04_11125, partial [Blautia pseudococcoides]|nr:hypothetical protein [Blautia pseudococcoides]